MKKEPFVLSGFLITGILLRARRDSPGESARTTILKSFYARRFLRIFPLYYLVVLSVTFLGIFATRETFWYNITYTSNIYFFLTNNWFSTVAHFWSLSVEEQFYLMWPWIVLCAPTRPLMPFVWGFVVVGVAAKVVLAGLMPSNNFIAALPFGAWDALGGGALLAILGPGSPSWKTFTCVCLLIGLPVWVSLWLLPSVGRWGAVFTQVRGTAMVLVCVSAVGYVSVAKPVGVGRILRWPLLVGLGVISYGLYILHPFVPIMWGVLVKALGLPSLSLPLRLVCWMALLLAMATLSWFLYEKPINRLKAKFPYRVRPVDAAGGGAAPKTRGAA